MATKITLLKSFVDGQGVSGGLDEYYNYPSDHDSNYTAIETMIFALIDEVAAANMFDAQIPLDLLIPSGLTKGRFGVNQARITRSGNVVTVSSGKVYIGTRISVTGAAFDYTALSNGTYAISVDPPSGVLSNTLAVAVPTGNQTIATVVWDGSMTDADITDALYNSGASLHSAISASFVEQLHDVNNPSITIFDNANDHALAPPVLRWKGKDGTLGDGGLMAADENPSFAWISRRATAVGSGNPVVAGKINQLGQLAPYVQARVHCERRTAQSITNSGAFIAVSFTAPSANAAAQRTDRRDPAPYFANPFLASGGGTTLTVPADASLNGTYLFSAFLEIAAVAGNATYVDARIRMTDSPASTVGRMRVAPAPTETVVQMSGMMDIAQGDTIELQVAHDSSTAVNLTFARLTLQMIGGEAGT